MLADEEESDLIGKEAIQMGLERWIMIELAIPVIIMSRKISIKYSEFNAGIS